MHHFILFESAHVEAGSDFAVITLLSFWRSRWIMNINSTANLPKYSDSNIDPFITLVALVCKGKRG